MAEPGADYQVFLSFRGPDTRWGFTDSLYHFLVDAGIRVFRDNEEIRPGEKIEEILRAINNSIVCIPIFSKDYASSKWCLRELAEMVERKKKIMPIFYDVTPDDVKLKTCLYQDALTKYNKEKEKEQWERALKEVLEISGWESSEDKEEKALKEVVKIRGWELKHVGHGELCKSIVKEVLVNLKVKHKVVTTDLVGMHERVETVLKHLDVQAPEVRYIGIYGLGGSGKTTLAKIVFNQFSAHFDACSFLANVRELSRDGLTHLQKKLIYDLQVKYSRDVSDTDDGMKTIKDMCRNKKVFIVLDDVDNREQIESLAGSSNWFSAGSRIIITTRDVRMLAANREGPGRDRSIKELWTLEMGEMDFKYALQLFSRHAFKMDFPPPEYLQLSNEVVYASGQFPLTLEIIGSYLYDKSIGEWEDKRNALTRIPPKDIRKKLMMSYEGLDFWTKQIFLDIACFTSDLGVQNAMYMWRSCGFHPETGLEELISLSLVKLRDNDKFWMHDHIRDLGREIICMKHFMDFGARSRLCNHEEAFGTLIRKEGTRKIEVLHLSSDVHLKNFSVTSEHFKNLPNLRYLSLGSLNLAGDFEHLFPRLRWLSWHWDNLEFTAINLNLEQLAILDLSGSCICENWEGWNQIRIGRQLAVLDLSFCKLSRTPNLSRVSCLERLILQGCYLLSEIDSSISNLKKLKHLNLKSCYSLRGLPKEIGSLESLEEIFLEGGHCSFNLLPESIGNLRYLLILEILNVNLIRLPHSIGGLQKLKRLSLMGCYGLKRIPDTLGDVKSLVELDLSRTGICELPNSLGDLEKLEQLYLSNCPVTENLPDSFGDLKCLSMLDISHSRVFELPYSIGNLEELKVMQMSHCWIRKLPRSIGAMKKLKRLCADSTPLQGEIPQEIGSLSCLRILDLSRTNICSLPSTISQLSSLGYLLLIQCDELEKLPSLPTSLVTLKFTSSLLQRPPDLSNLSSLTTLELDGVSHSARFRPLDLFGKERSGKLEYADPKMGNNIISPSMSWICDLSKLEKFMLRIPNITTLPVELGALRKLRSFELGCPDLHDVPPLPPCLCRLVLAHLKVNTEPPCLSSMSNLAYLELSECFIKEDGMRRLGIGEMERLESLALKSVWSELSGLRLPACLKSLNLHLCTHVKRLPDLSHSKNLQRLNVTKCSELVEIPGLEELEELQYLTVYNCRLLSIEVNASKLTKLHNIEVDRGVLLYREN